MFQLTGIKDVLKFEPYTVSLASIRQLQDLEDHMEQKFLFQINLLQLLLLLQISLKNLSDFGSLLRIIQNSLGKDHPMCLTIRLGL